MTTSRLLDDFEVNVMGFAPSHAIEYAGTLDSPALRQAFELLCHRYPALRARVEPTDDGHLLHASPSEFPDLTIVDGDENTLRENANAPWDPARGVAELLVVSGPGRGYVSLRADHAIGDGTSFRTMFNDLWSLYTDVVNGTVRSIPQNSDLPRPPSEVFGRLPAFQLDSTLDEIRARVPLAVSPAVERRIHLTREDTQALISSTRALKTSMHALTCGAVLAALRDHGAPTGPVPMVCWSLVNLRNLAMPPVGATETTNFAARHRAFLRVPEKSDPITIGMEVKRQMNTDMAENKLMINPVRSPPPHVPTSLEQHLATVSVSNNGIVPRLPQPDDISIVDFLIPSYPMTVLFPTYSAYTYEDRLSIRVVYPTDLFDDSSVELLIGATTEGLERMAAFAAAPG